MRLQLHTLACNLVSFMPTLALPEEVGHWSLTTPGETPVKIGARIVRHGRCVVFQLAEVAVPHALIIAILRRINRDAAGPEKQIRVGPAIDVRRRLRIGQNQSRYAKKAQKIFVPLLVVKIEQQRARGGYFDSCPARHLNAAPLSDNDPCPRSRPP